MDKPASDDAPTVVNPQNTSPAFPGEVRVGDCIKGRFILEEEIGRGGMGIVFRALDLRKQETGDKEPYIAIKVISNALKRLPESLIALQREAKKAQKLAHPNIATVYDFDRDGDEAFLTMELLEGSSLSDLLKNEFSNGISFTEALPIIQGVARGLAYAHQQGIVHSDFKPGNVFICDTGFVKILDFGIARAVSKKTDVDNNEQTLFDPGDWDAITPAYASFEMFYHAPPDPRDDIYALACVSYQLLSGNHPFDKLAAPKARAEGRKVKPIAGINRNVHKLLVHSLAFERNERLASVSEFLEAIVPRKNTKSLLFMAGIFLCMASLVAYNVWYKTQQINLVETAIEQGDPWLSSPQPVNAEISEKINRLLTVAESHLSIGRYIKPSTSNAAEAYMEVLRLQPGNKRALAGVTIIIRQLEKEMHLMLEQNKPHAARELIQLATSKLPGEKHLLELEKGLADQAATD